MKFRLSIITLLLSLSIFSQEIITDRPDQTESSSNIQKGSLQIEMGLVASSKENKTLNSFTGPSTLMRYGITDKIELRLFNQYESYKLELFDETNNVSGFSDLEIGVKVQLLKKEDVNTEIALISHVVIPTAKNELSNGKLGTINKLSISHSFSDRLEIGYNVGYDYVGQIHSFTYSAALGISFTDNFGGYIEPFGVYREQGFFESYLDGGLTYLVRDNFQLDVSYGLGLNNDLQYFSAGFSWNIPKLFGSKNL